MSDSFKIQQNVKVNNDLINLRADDANEFKAIAEWVIENAALFVNVAAALNAVPPALAANVASVQVQTEPAPQQNGGWGQPQQQAPSFAQPQQAPQYGQPQEQGPACRHGARAFKSGTSKAGKPYKMWACPSSNRQDQCEPQWVRD